MEGGGRISKNVYLVIFFILHNLDISGSKEIRDLSEKSSSA